MKKVKNLLIISLGSIGIKHLKIIRLIRPEIKIYTLRKEKNKKFKFHKEINGTFTNLNEAIKFGIDAAIISSPCNLHIEQSIKLSQYKIPLLIEKPLSNNLDECFELLELVEKEKNIILIGYVLRHKSILNKFREIIINEKQDNLKSVLIECSTYLPDWRTNIDYRNSVSAKKSLGGGCLLELSHELDYANWIFGPLKKINGKLNNSCTLDIDTDVDDEVKIVAQNKDDLTLKINLDFYRNGKKRYCFVELINGFIKLDFLKNHIIYEKNNISKTINFNEENEEMYKVQMSHFISCIEEDIQPYVTLDDGISTMKLINSVLSSNLSNIG